LTNTMDLDLTDGWSFFFFCSIDYSVSSFRLLCLLSVLHVGKMCVGLSVRVCVCVSVVCM
jgi:hypothetical protein